MNTRSTFAVSMALSGLITAGLATAAFAPLSPITGPVASRAAPPAAALQRLPTVVVTPDMQVMPEVVVIADPADFDDSGSNDPYASGFARPARQFGGQMVRQAAFDMPYYSFAKAHTRTAKE